MSNDQNASSSRQRRKRHSTSHSKQRRRSSRREQMENMKPRYSVNAMDDEDVASYYDRTAGALLISGIVLIVFGAITTIGEVRGSSITFPDIIGSLPIEFALIFAGVLVFAFREPPTYLALGLALGWAVLVRFFVPPEQTFPYRPLILSVITGYLIVQFINFGRARERYASLPEKYKDPEIDYKENLASPDIYAISGLALGILGLAAVFVGTRLITSEILLTLASWLGLLGFSLSATGSFTSKKLILSIVGLASSTAALALWLSAII